MDALCTLSDQILERLLLKTISSNLKYIEYFIDSFGAACEKKKKST